MNFHPSTIIAASAYDGHVRLYRIVQPLIELGNCRASLQLAQWKYWGYNRLIHKLAARGCLIRAKRMRLGV